MASMEERSSPIEKIAEDESQETKVSSEAKDPLKAEEEKFKQKYPNFNKRGAVPSLLHKRLHKGMKYFDSGDYNMAKDSARKKGLPLPPSAVPDPNNQAAQEKATSSLLQESTGDTIPTPENVPARKTSTCITTQAIHPITMRASLQS